MKRLGQSAIVFVAIGLVIYAGVYFAAERLMYHNGRSNPFFKIAIAEDRPYDWAILGASHAMPLDFADFNAQMQRETGLRIINLASPGTGPLYNRFVLEHFLRRHRAGNVLYVLDSFAFYSRMWNEDRFADAKLLRGTPFDPAIAERLWDYSRREDVDIRAVLDYVTGFSKINNSERFQQDIWEGEPQFDRVYRTSATAVRSRIAYLYPDSAAPAALARYLAEFSAMLEFADRAGVHVAVIKVPTPAQFRTRLPDEGAFDEAVSRLLATRAIALHDFSASMDDPRFYFDTDHLNRAGLTEFLSLHLKDILVSAARD